MAGRIAIIGGTGLYHLFDDANPIDVETPYGDVTMEIGHISGREVLFMPRHGKAHAVPPHKINFRANLWALAAAGAHHVLAVNTVGSLRQEIQPRTFVIAHDLLDFSARQDRTFYDDQAVHVDMTEPYCPDLRRALAHAARDVAGAPRARDGGVYAAVQGPRLETAAEIRFLAQAGADVVGMTGAPEAALAREKAMCYATLCLVANYGAGLAGKLRTEDVKRAAADMDLDTRAILAKAVAGVPSHRECHCARALEGAAL